MSNAVVLRQVSAATGLYAPEPVLPREECPTHQGQVHSLFFNYITCSKSYPIAAYFIFELYISYKIFTFLTKAIAFVFSPLTEDVSTLMTSRRENRAGS